MSLAGLSRVVLSLAVGAGIGNTFGVAAEHIYESKGDFKSLPNALKTRSAGKFAEATKKIGAVAGLVLGGSQSLVSSAAAVLAMNITEDLGELLGKKLLTSFEYAKTEEVSKEESSTHPERSIAEFAKQYGPKLSGFVLGFALSRRYLGLNFA